MLGALGNYRALNKVPLAALARNGMKRNPSTNYTTLRDSRTWRFASTIRKTFAGRHGRSLIIKGLLGDLGLQTEGSGLKIQGFRASNFGFRGLELKLGVYRVHRALGG